MARGENAKHGDVTHEIAGHEMQDMKMQDLKMLDTRMQWHETIAHLPGSYRVLVQVRNVVI